MTSITDSRPPVPTTPDAGRVSRTLVRHGAEMFLAMAVGMLVVGGARSAVGLDVAFAAHPGGSYLLMATDMAVGMAAWMWLRRHAWVVTLEMCLAMYLPVVLLPLVRANALSTTAFMVLAHTLMVVAMVVVLVRHHRGLTVDGTGVR